MSFTIGSLFDGSGGFPLAAFMCGGTPVWASEIEPYPIAVTKTRFPYMKHIGSVTDIKGNEIEPVDVITFGSPCQDLSVAGKRAGLKHTENGDEETTRSGLFMDAVRIIKEMREATNGVYPRFAVWENVPGAFSSNKGEDFRTVCEELIKIVEPGAVMPAVPKNGWPYADCYCGEGWSLSYRTYDAQYWGVPQRRRRIYLVADFRGECAGEVSFEREGLRGYFETGRTPWKAVAGDAGEGTGGAVFCLQGNGIDRAETAGCNGKGWCEDVSYTLNTIDRHAVMGFAYRAGAKAGSVAAEEEMGPTLLAGRNDAAVYDARGNGDGRIAPTIIGDHQNRVTDYTSILLDDQGGSQISVREDGKSCTLRAETHGNIPCVLEETVCLDVGFFNSYQECSPTLLARGYKDPHLINGPKQKVRRLTPLECERMQGFPDRWATPDKKAEFTDEEYDFWLNVRNTHAEINGKAVKEYTKDQMLNWYNKLHTDSAEYKLWGNGIALPCALYVMQGIAEVFADERN